jgi:two-component system, sensor histidine kinase and response regulator
VARIVLIDDENELRGVLGEILTSAGYEVVLAASGQEGLAAVRAERPDAVVCDINMPGMDGFGVLRAIRADPETASLPFVFLTSEAAVRAGMLSGADDYLTKPVAADELLAAVRARIERGETARRDAERRLGEMRRAVAALLPHELRTPLTVIMGSASLLQELHADFGPEEIQALGTGILKAAHRLHRMAENYILYADLELRRLSGTREPSSAGSGAKDVREAAKEAAAEAGRPDDLALDLHDVRVPMEPAYLGKVVSELVDNALKFSDRGTTVTVSLAAEGGADVLEIVDRGTGMAADQVNRVGAFQQFDRGRFEQRGSGVGLALVRSIAEATGASLEINSRLAQGTTVRVRWKDHR